MAEQFSEIRSPRGRSILVHNNYKFSLFLKDAVRGDQWRCINRRCPAYVLTQGEEGHRFITHSDAQHIHKPGDTSKVRTSQRLSATAKKMFPEVFQKSSRKSLQAYVGKFNGLLSDELTNMRHTAKRRKRKELLENAKRPVPFKNKVGISDHEDDNLSVPTDTEYFEVDESMATSDFLSTTPDPPSRSHIVGPTISNNFQNEFEIAGWTYGNHLRLLDPEQRIIVENLVSDIIFKGKLKRLRADTKIV